MNNINAIVTGASEGLGFEIAKVFAKAGIGLSICARTETKIKNAENVISKFSNKKIHSKSVDISSESQIDKFIQESIAFHGSINILVNNAGIYGPKGEFESNNWEEWKNSININLMGNVYTIKKLIPHFKAQNFGKIIQLSGGGATSPLPNLTSYAVAKAGIVRFIETIAKELSEFNIQANSIAPGALNTRLLDEILNEGPEIIGEDFYNKSLKQKDDGGADFKHACELALFLATDMHPEITGKLISAIWDNWNIFNSCKDDLRSSDVFTITRIAGRDRNLSELDK